jgi:hypothetical protein
MLSAIVFRRKVSDCFHFVGMNRDWQMTLRHAYCIQVMHVRVTALLPFRDILSVWPNCRRYTVSCSTDDHDHDFGN